MQLNNPFQMNDWAIGKFLKAILAIQLAVWSAIGLCPSTIFHLNKNFIYQHSIIRTYGTKKRTI